MSAPQQATAPDNGILLFLFAVLGFAGSLATLITGAILGKIDDTIILTIAPWLVLSMAGVSAYYYRD